MIDIKTEFTGTINPTLGLPDMVISMGDSSMNTTELTETQFDILNTLINNQIKHDNLTNDATDNQEVCG